jgi:hypothetical protein
MAKLHTSGFISIGMNMSWTHGWSHYYCWQTDCYWKHIVSKEIQSLAVFYRANNGPPPWAKHNPLNIPCYRLEPDDWPSKFAGMLAIRLAKFMGFQETYLLGYDARPGEGHHCDDKRARRCFMPKHLAELQLELGDMQVFNANESSAIRCFPFKKPY